MRPDGPRDAVAGPDAGPQPPFPLRLDGKVIKGFGRGSKELGIPTANIPIEGLSIGGHEDVESGVYYGWAGLSPGHLTHGLDSSGQDGASGETGQDTSERATKDSGHGAVYPMVMSIGWNPYYKNTVRSVEVHIMRHFESDFYGSHMNLLILGYIRPELDYVSKESLIEDIRTDIKVAETSLARPAYTRSKEDPALRQFDGKGDVGS